MPQLLAGLGDDRGRVLLARRVVGNAQGVARFEQLERSLAVHAEDRVLNMRVGGGVGASRDELELGVDVFAGGAADDGTLSHHHVAGLGDGEVGLGGDDHAEALQVGIGFELRVAVMVQREFAEVNGTSLR